MRRTTAFLAVTFLIAACSSDRSSDGSTVTTGAATSVETTTPSDTGVSTTAPDTAVPTTAVPATAVPTSLVPTTVVPTTAVPATVPCAPAGDTDPKGEQGVLDMSSMVGVDIRVGDHACYERVVVELGGTGQFPGWGVEYVDDPVRLGESDEFTYIDGDATLLLRMGMWMPDMEGSGYDGPIQFFPTTVDHIVELRQTENFEGITIWAIGLDEEYPFTVSQLSSPARLVIDFHVAE